MRTISNGRAKGGKCNIHTVYNLDNTKKKKGEGLENKHRTRLFKEFGFIQKQNPKLTIFCVIAYLVKMVATNNHIV